MWQQQPDYARYKEKANGEGWLVNRQEGMLIQIKPDAPTQHAQFVLVSYYRLSARIGKPVRQQRMLRHLGIEMWINLQKIGWQRCTPPNWLPVWGTGQQRRPLEWGIRIRSVSAMVNTSRGCPLDNTESNETFYFCRYRSPAQNYLVNAQEEINYDWNTTRNRHLGVQPICHFHDYLRLRLHHTN